MLSLRVVYFLRVGKDSVFSLFRKSKKTLRIRFLGGSQESVVGSRESGVGKTESQEVRKIVGKLGSREVGKELGACNLKK